MVPIIGLDNSDMNGREGAEWNAGVLGGAGAFTATQPERLVKAIAGELGIQDCRFWLSDCESSAKITQTAVLSIGSWSSSTLNPRS